jgi:Flp pilus assembly protein TadG
MLSARFFKNCKAGVAPLFALGIIPLVGSVGAAVDYSRANSVRAAMQAAGDATALMLAKTGNSLNNTQLQASATAYFLANFNRPEAEDLHVVATYSSGAQGFNVTVNGTAKVHTNFMGMMGFTQIPLSTTASVTWNNAKLRVALVLDNTGSMAETDSTGTSKIIALKTATHNLLSQLKTAARNDGDVYVSIVPFGKDVNVGASNSSASWIDWTDWDAVNGTCSNSSYHSKSTCQSHGKVWTPKNHNTWNGCVTDRDQNYDTMNTAPTTGAKFPAEQYASCSTSIMALSYNWTALNNKIDAMTPAGNTNQAIGLVWGWQSLTQTAPLNAPALDPTYQYKQIIILLSDGLNTQDRWYSNASPIDARQQTACNNAKAAGITIYTVLVMSGNSSVLQGCASDATKYFALTDANSIITTFDTIGTSLSKLHLSR